VFKHEGTLDKFIGDCIMAVFGAPLEMDDHAARAVTAAIDMKEALRQLNEDMPEADRVEFRVGMHSGRVVAGDIGSARRSDYTVLGATVNLAARLQSAVAEPGQIIISQVTLDALGDRFDVRPVGEYQPKGISRMVRCYEVVGRRSLLATMMNRGGGLSAPSGDFREAPARGCPRDRWAARSRRE
jgi:adenylate cyclase